ncbi:MAG: DUF1554 domain-containing protein, partial [archaeon]
GIRCPNSYWESPDAVWPTESGCNAALDDVHLFPYSCDDYYCACTFIPYGECGDGVCDEGESCGTCSMDCGVCAAFCGDGTCDSNETCSNCETDCGSCTETCCVDSDGSDYYTKGTTSWICSDQFTMTDYCENGKVKEGACPRPIEYSLLTLTCPAGETCSDGICVPLPETYCGDGTCNADEDCNTCESDCGACISFCGDGTCDADEDCNTCSGDCGLCENATNTTTCGNFICDASESCITCPFDCGECLSDCGDTLCDRNESCLTCPIDCGVCSGSYSIGMMFVSSAIFNGNLGGLTGADAKCQQIADAAGISGTWMALLGDATTKAKDRIPDMMYTRMDGTVLALNKADLFDGSINLKLDLDELGNEVYADRVWTGSNADGSTTSTNCQSWTSGSMSQYGTVGHTYYSGNQWLYYSSSPLCSNTVHIYCLRTS